MEPTTPSQQTLHDTIEEEIKKDDDLESVPTSTIRPRSDEMSIGDVEAQPHAQLQCPPSVQEKRLDPDIVDWHGPQDPEHPQNWSKSTKWAITAVSGLQCFAVTVGSSIFSAAVRPTAEEFGVSQEVMILGVALYVAGFATGPMVFGPMSEIYGRKLPILIGLVGFIVFQIPLGVATNLQTIFISRFFAGAFGTAPLAVDPGMFVDIWDPPNRGAASTLFAFSIFCGPAVGPIVGQFTVKNPSLGWRWTAWFTMIMGAFTLVISLPVLKETLPPLLLQRKAAKLRAQTQNWALHTETDGHLMTFRDIAVKYGLKPFKMFFLEPILVFMTIFIALVYSILYLTFAAFPYAFQEIRHWETGVASLPFIGVALGSALANLIILIDSKTRFRKTVIRNRGKVIPEERLPPMMFGAVILTIGLFWFAWTSKPSVSWVPQVIATVPIGLGIILVFLPGIIYLTDTYMMHANSALAVNALTRCLSACGFSMFALPMFGNLGLQWAVSLLGFLCLALTPFTFLFYFYGKKIRAWSKYAVVL